MAKSLMFICSLNVLDLSQSVWDSVRQKSSNTQIPSSLPDVVAWYIQNVKGDGFQELDFKECVSCLGVGSITSGGKGIKGFFNTRLHPMIWSSLKV